MSAEFSGTVSGGLAKNGAEAGGAGKAGEFGDIADSFRHVGDNSFGDLNAQRGNVTHDRSAQNFLKDVVKMKGRNAEMLRQRGQGERLAEMMLNVIPGFEAQSDMFYGSR